MRIISGKYGGRVIKAKLPSGIRPTTDANRENIFNILGNLLDFEDLIVYDLFSGSGLLGIESLSRGAAFCFFNDKSKKTVEYIKNSLIELGIETSKYKISNSDTLKLISTLNTNYKFDIFFSDPPYELRLNNKVINLIHSNQLLSDNGIIVIEADRNENINYKDNYELIKEKSNSGTKLLFLKNKL